jgi:hypothetical protein
LTDFIRKTAIYTNTKLILVDVFFTATTAGLRRPEPYITSQKFTAGSQYKYWEKGSSGKERKKYIRRKYLRWIKANTPVI